MSFRALLVLALVLLAACSRGGAPQPAGTPSPGTPPAPTPSATAVTPTEQASAGVTASESASEELDLTGPLADAAVLPGISNDDAWVALGEPRTLEGFDRWQRSRGIAGGAVDLAEDLDTTYGFDSEIEVGYVHRRGARSEAPRIRQLLVARFERGDDGLSEAWCSVDEEGREAVDLPDDTQVDRAVQRLVALPGSCGAVRELRDDTGRFQADISFRFGRHMVQVVAVEADPVVALKALSRTAPLVHDRLVDFVD